MSAAHGRATRRPRLSLRLRIAAWSALSIWLAGLIVIAVFTQAATNRVEEFRTGLQADLLTGLGDGPIALPDGVGQRLLEGARDVAEETVGRQIREIRRLALLAMLALGVGGAGASYLIAVRTLQPLGEMTRTARRLSTDELGERIPVEGPEDELADLAEAFNGMLDRLETAFAAQRSFGANAGHELRTPLQVVRSEVDINLAGHHDVDVAEAAEGIRTALDRAEDLIDSLLVLARGEQQPAREVVDLAVLADRALAEHRLGDRLVAALAPTAVLADPSLCQLMVDNLVHNAVRHNVEGGRVAVTTDGQRLQVINDGPVLAPAEVARLGERFYRPDTSRSRTTGGSGLGLSIVAMAARVHGADLALVGRPEGGLEVTVTFPERAG